MMKNLLTAEFAEYAEGKAKMLCDLSVLCGKNYFNAASAAS
jgi:hypothetical protein